MSAAATRRERLIASATRAVCDRMEHDGVSRTELASRLGKSKGFVSQVLAGNRNMTLGTLAEIGDALGVEFTVSDDARAHHLLRRARLCMDNVHRDGISAGFVKTREEIAAFLGQPNDADMFAPLNYRLVEEGSTDVPER